MLKFELPKEISPATEKGTRDFLKFLNDRHLARHPGDGSVSALGWNATGSELLFGLESGPAGLLSLPT